MLLPNFVFGWICRSKVLTTRLQWAALYRRLPVGSHLDFAVAAKVRSDGPHRSGGIHWSMGAMGSSHQSTPTAHSGSVKFVLRALAARKMS